MKYINSPPIQAHNDILYNVEKDRSIGFPAINLFSNEPHILWTLVNFKLKFYPLDDIYISELVSPVAFEK